MLPQALREPRAVAEARRVPQQQALALGGLEQRIVRRHRRHVGRVAHFADVARQQRARERRLARVRVRDERERDRVRHRQRIVSANAASSARSARREVRGREIHEQHRAAMVTAQRAPQCAARLEACSLVAVAAAPCGLVDHDQWRLAGRRVARQRGQECAVRLRFRCRGEIEQADDAIARRRRVGQRILAAVGDGRRDGHRRIAAKRTDEQRLEIRACRGVGREAVRHDRRGGRPVVQPAQQPSKVRFVERHREVRRAIAFEQAGAEREHQPRHDDHDRERASDEMQPGRRVHAGRRAHRVDLRYIRDRCRGQPRAGRIRERKQRPHRRRFEERALPRRAVLECDAPQVQAREQAERQRRRSEVQDARGARGIQRRRLHGPLLREFRQRLRHRVGGIAPGRIRAGAAPRDPRHRAAQRTHRARFAVPHDEACRQDRVDRDVPHEEQQHGRREHVDALRAADAIARDAEHEGERDDDHTDPRPPLPRAHHPWQQLRALGEPLERQLRAARDEGRARRRGADHLRGRAGRPRTIVVGPQRPRAIGHFDRAHGRDREGALLVHGRHATCAAPARGRRSRSRQRLRGGSGARASFGRGPNSGTFGGFFATSSSAVASARSS